MTHKLWQKKLKIKISQNIIDIIQFGSSIFLDSKPNDIDIAVIFNKITLKEQLNESQKIKEQLNQQTDIPIHIKSYDFYSLLDKSNFAREGILFYAKSLITQKNFTEHFGLIPKLRIQYNLSNLEKKEKVKFNYTLSGKQGKYGLLKKYNGKLIAPKTIEINPEHEKIFIQKLKKITNKIETKRIFIQTN
jgi:hypothetical protein